MQTPDEIHSWSPQTRYTVSLLLLAAALAVLYYARELLAALTIALLISIVLSPLVRLLKNRTRLGHSGAVLVTFLLFFLLLLAIPVVGGPLVWRQVGFLAADLAALTAELQEVAAGGEPVPFDLELPILDWLETVQINTLSMALPENLMGLFRNVSQNMAWLLVIFVTVYYLLQDGQRLREWLIAQTPEYRREDAVRLFLEIREVWQAYLRGQVVLMLLVGVTTWIGAAAIGLRGAWAIGLLAGLLDIVPSVGPALAAIVAVVVAWLTGSTWIAVSNPVFVLIVIAVFGVVQTVENIWWRPKVMGNSLKMHPAVIFIGVIGALTLSGVMLTLVIVPLMGTVAVMGRYVQARLYGLPPWPESELGVMVESVDESAD
jgi:predicted PurR-regulated permease PerM